MSQLRQNLYFCTSKARKLSACDLRRGPKILLGDVVRSLVVEFSHVRALGGLMHRAEVVVRHCHHCPDRVDPRTATVATRHK